jgi:predicted transglutaminase-like cysteine proteinase
LLSRRHLLCGLGALAAGATLPLSAQAAITGLQGPLPLSTEMSYGDFVPAPAAWFNLLRQHPELDPQSTPMASVNLTPARAALLMKVNKEVNREVSYRADAGSDVWTVGGREGDCEDIAIRKLAVLTQVHGVSRGALTLAACRLDYSRGHAVLLVHSDSGVYVMDSLTSRVAPWRSLPYSWTAREEPGAPFRLWRSLKV